MVPRSSTLRRLSARFALAAIGLVAPSLLLAQGSSQGTVTGKIVDAQNQRPLSGAFVVIAGTQQGVETREDGTYRILLRSGTHELRARIIGYGSMVATVNVTAGGTTTQDFALQKAVVNLGEVAVVGTRAAARTVTAAPVPIDILGQAELQSTGVTETNQVIQMLAPSFNFPRPSIADGTDHIRPATLRGLGPDQVLVLVNGKRRHNSALVNVNGTVGRGSTGVDMNAIPLSAIDHIEILRDGAAAQYGSDAIAGVINIVLKSEPRTDAVFQTGQTYARDGDNYLVGASKGVGSASGSFVNVAGEFHHRDYTNRANVDTVPPFFAGDLRNTDPQYRNVLRWRHGDPLVNEGGAFYNAGMSLGSGIQLYSFGGASLRKGDSPANFRRTSSNGTIRAFYPYGFLPHIDSRIVDVSVGAGAKGVAKDWNWDLSSVYGGNRFRFDVRNSDNASMGLASPRDFYAGTLVFSQHTTNLDLSRAFGVTNVATGAELRFDRYKIWAGDQASYLNGNVRVLDGPNAGAIAPAGAQSFPGFQPSDATNQIRNNLAGYLDVESHPTGVFTVGAAGRAERYSDFGSTVTGKTNARLEFFPGYAVRGAVGTGFRAPSLAQEFFSSTATNFIGGVPFDIKTFPAESPGGKALGAVPLKPEKSLNISAGLTADPLRSLSLSVDYYKININDRIVFSENFTTAAIRNLLAAQGFPTLGGGRFFTNAIDTRTRGLDVVGRYGVNFASDATFRLTAGANWTKTKAKRTSATPPQLAGLDETLFGQVEKTRIERGQPRRTIHINGELTAGNWNVTAHEAYFGAHTGATTFGATAAYVEQHFSGAWITDASIGYTFARGLTLAIGGNNLFDKYPDAIGPAFNNNGVLHYPNTSPWGFNGGSYYAKLSWHPGR